MLPHAFGGQDVAAGQEAVAPPGDGFDGIALRPELPDGLPDRGAAQGETARELLAGQVFALPLLQQGQNVVLRHAAPPLLIRTGCRRSTKALASAIFSASGSR